MWSGRWRLGESRQAIIRISERGRSGVPDAAASILAECALISAMLQGRIRLIAMILSATSLSMAQTGTGNIQGSVRDATGAVVPKAKVAVVHTATARDYVTETNEVGFYIFPVMQGGAYEVSSEFAGMEPWKGTLTLAAGQSAVVDVVLRPASAATTVTVAGDVTPLITTNSPTLSTILERQRIEQLPIHGRFITTLLYMTKPGV